MEQIRDLLTRLTAQTELTYDRLPDIDLYMDQVIEYLARHSLSARDNDKISSAMINNYIKDGLLPRATDKKYSRVHLAYLLMIARLKQALSVKDTGTLLQAGNEKADIATYFNDFQALLSETAHTVSAMIPEEEKELPEAVLRLAVTGYVCRMFCEILLSSLSETDKPNGNEESSTDKNDEK